MDYTKCIACGNHLICWRQGSMYRISASNLYLIVIRRHLCCPALAYRQLNHDARVNKSFKSAFILSGPILDSLHHFVNCSTHQLLVGTGLKGFRLQANLDRKRASSYLEIPAFLLKALMRPLVLASWLLLCSGSSSSDKIFLARTLPSSTPHWSKLLMFQMAPSVKVTCS